MRSEDWQVRFIQLLSLFGLFVAYYLLLFHNGSLVDACSASAWDDCGRVSGPDAPYAAIGPVPVALIGLLGYAAIFLLTWLKEWSVSLEKYLPELLMGLASLAFLFTLGLTGLELFVIQAVCRYCLVSAGIVTIIFVLSINYLRANERVIVDERGAL